MVAKSRLPPYSSATLRKGPASTASGKPKTSVKNRADSSRFSE
ncbi:Uncharacterised protein [Mycobacteroides abscessus subsp. abscessus]|nr:Uncharacterised protein [Mycobacteroides abscessus subsp. abscessus]SKU38300.1 Uncharacterised protein [Mycobacteroides abscessus subsp. abscessus]SKW24200.1 Uncharacterised protein [Mycobacteroides abscessus subsp. abscessus]